MFNSRIVFAWLASAATALILTSSAAGAAAQSVSRPSKPSLAEPSLSPDGREIAFVSGGDIWTVPSAGGQAQLLISNPATESRPLYSPKGDQIAFTSTRDGAANIYVLTLASGEIRRLTWSDVGEQLDGWSADGRYLYFTSGAADIARQGDIFRVPVTGGTPMAVSNEPFLAEFTSAPSPDGRSIALMAKGAMANSQWWRNGHSHLDQTELWTKTVAGTGGYRRLLPATAKHLWPMWSADGRSLFYMSDESGAENLWRIGSDGAAPRKLTSFTSGRVLFPSVAADGKAIVFERGMEIWKYDIAAGRASAVPIALRGAPAGPGERRLTETRFRELSLSPDGKKLAVIARGALFAASAKDGGLGQRVSREGDLASGVVWTPDSKRVIYAAKTGLASNLVLYDFAAAKAQALTAGPGFASAPTVSPDGKMIAYRKGANELRVMTLAANGTVTKDVVIFNEMREAGDADTPAWSPDSQWVAFGVTDPRSFRNVWVAPAAGGQARPISFLANGQTASQITWSPDGKFILFHTAQRSEDSHLVRVDLIPHLPKYREDEFNELFKPNSTPDKEAPRPTPASQPGAAAKSAAAATPEDEDKAEAASAESKPAAKKKPEPVVIDFTGIRTRATFIPVGLNAEQPIVSPDGKTLVFRAEIGGRQNLFSYDLSETRKEPATPQQLTTTVGTKGFAVFTPDSKSVYLLDGGAIITTPLEAPRAKTIGVEADLTVDFNDEKLVVFDEAWDYLDRTFFDPKFNGQDWPALRARYAPYIAGARTADEMRRDINLMIGELNASHSGINPPGGTVPQRVGDLGLTFDREAYEAGRGLIVASVVSLGPADLTGAIRPGARLLAVNGQRIEAATNLNALLLDQAGKRVVLQIADGAAGAPREVIIKPVSTGAAGGLRYRDWVEGRRAYVARVSNGRLGYVHLADMSADSLNQLYLDLDAENQGREGVVIDVRNNNGGFVNGYVLDVFSRKNFLQMTPRDLYALPSRQALGQRALGLPTVLVTNEGSLSDAEDFTEGYRALGLGKVVGVPTAGWIIYTSNQRLIDGSAVRLPSVRIQDAKGGDLEMHPRPVDVTVERPLGDAALGRDAQLDAAVAELLKGLPSRR